ncbi:MAG: metallophosphoesterase [Miltoncostaeaceae bacterium]
MAAPKSLAVVLSDVHIGNGAPTAWYQPAVHDPYLVRALDWAIEIKDSIRELILLGDLVDLWTYPPGVRPPSMAEIIAANPATLGPGGALARTVAALPPGAVKLLLGNHDGTLDRADIDLLSASVGPIELVDEVHTVTSASGARTTFTHGHLWTMFNAPDDRSPWAPLPVGHFVTRAFAYQMAKLLKPGQTVADLANMGAPNGFDLSQFLHSLSPTLDPSVSSMLLDYVAGVAGLPHDLPIILPDGSTTTLDAAKAAYADLFTEWVAKEGGPLNAARAAFADQWGDHLAWFAQRLAIQTGSDLVVMGHTHTPITGLAGSPVHYVNSGFQCPSRPDVPPKEFTFTAVDLEHASAEVFQVAKGADGLTVGPYPRHEIPVVQPPALDYSCYVRITNTGHEPMTLTSAPTPKHGYWVVPPAPSIPAGGRADMWLQDLPGLQGTEGGAVYSRGSATLAFSFSCPFPDPWPWPNTASGAGGNFVAKSGSGDWQGRGRVPSFGYPLQVRFSA